MSSSGLAHLAVSQPESYAADRRNHHTPLPQLHVWCRDCVCEVCVVSACECVRLKKSLLITTTFVLLTSDVSERQTDHNKITVSLMFLCGLRTHSRTHFYTQCIAITLMRSLLSAFCVALLWSPCNRSWPFSQSGECYDGALLTFAQCSFSKAEMSLARSQASRSSFNALASASA